MPGRILEIVPCPPTLAPQAFALALGDLTPAQRRELVPSFSDETLAGLQIALCGGELCGAAWGQPQPGNTAIFWPPKFDGPTDDDTTCNLCTAVTAALDALGIRMTQALVHGRRAAVVKSLESAGFACLADLLYLSWEATASPHDRPERTPLEFEVYSESQRARLARLVEQTYEATQDCAAMNGKRPMEEVLAGYQATGVFRPSQWIFVRAAEKDAGVLLMADHPAAEHWELMYMGVVPAARGHHFGREIVRHAQQLAANAGTKRIVLAVDAANLAAIKMYHDAGFTAWDERTVYVRFHAEAPRAGA